MYVTLSFKFRQRDEVERFILFLEKHLRGNYIVTTRLTHVYVQIEGENLKEAVALVKKLAALAKGGYGKRQIPLLILFKDVNLVRPIPPDLIADVLTLRGIESKVKGGYLETAVEYEEVLKIAEELSNLYQDAERYPLTPHAKKIVVAYAYSRGLSLDAAVERLVEAGVLNRGKVISLREDYSRAKLRLLKI
ncbi:MAG: DUF2067 family protein [Pyrobaculum sp.]